MVQSLPGFLNLSLNVCSPCQVLGDVYPEVLEAAHPLHRGGSCGGAHPLPCRDNAEREEEVQRQEIRFNIAVRNLKGKVHTHRQAYQVHI